jgi:hypothetical protein
MDRRRGARALDEPAANQVASAAAARDVDLDQLPKISDRMAEHKPKPERGRGR